MRDRLLHLADLHLGASIDARLRETLPGVAAQFARARDDIVSRIADWVSDEASRIAGVIIAGDLFERHNPPPDLADRTRIALARIAAVAKVVLVPGNHDEWSYPECVYRRGDWPGLQTSTEPVLAATIPLDGGRDIDVFTVTYEAGRRAPGAMVSFPRSDRGNPWIAVAHGTLTNRYSGAVAEGERCLRLSDEQLGAAGCAYAALGHIHSSREFRSGSCLAVYPGPIVGPTASDRGPASLCVVRFDDERAGVERTAPAEVIEWHWRETTVTVTPDTTVDDALRQVERVAAAAQSVLLVQLTGTTTTPELATSLQQRLIMEGRTALVVDGALEQSREIDLAAIEREASLAGEFVRAWRRWREEGAADSALAALTLREGLNALGVGRTA